jgi:hypothetical protein
MSGGDGLAGAVVLVAMEPVQWQEYLRIKVQSAARNFVVVHKPHNIYELDEKY